ncbi:glycerophosphodiester phosphodiesterase [Paenarthrobacter sp. Z7-10]|uniref:glycerophosphodiester phosphodiesterase n=1 Tax=Paenarthrobacter sp. Z7-10 TaxID=2787635 RepID=UPI0022A9C607|nr:glycerophosphodiester phosphodiesterase family protein [Paenarthrobacter sp. Z7-10]MCZ2403370.1 glycerophosphodiester phosphodiesterase [Paenarthrobacter sp. Z7-10]
MRPLIYAHRGSSGHFAEHTRAAYLQALADGVDGVECDLHLSSDQELVLLHDNTVDRTSNGSGPVASMTLAQLRELDFSAWKGAAVPAQFGGTAQQFLTLAELLSILHAAGRELALAIEFKHPKGFDERLEARTLQELRAAGWVPENSHLGNIRVSFMSFHPQSVKYLARSVPAGCLCQLLDDVESAALEAEAAADSEAGAARAAKLRAVQAEAERLLDAGEVGLAGPGVDYLRSHPDRVRSWLSAGSRLRVWTVDEPEDLQLCIELGVQEITTNLPARIRGLLPVNCD